MKLRLLSIIMGLMIAVITTLSSARAEPVKIRLAYGIVPLTISPLLFKKKELLKHYGKSYVIEGTYIRATSIVLQAMAAGEIDVGYISFTALANAIINGGIDIKVIADVASWASQGHQGPELVVRADSGIKKVSDLKGKVLAVSARGTGFHYALLANLKKAGIDKKDVTIVEVRIPAMNAALRAKKVDGVMIPPPFLYSAEKAGNAKRLFKPEDAMGDIQALMLTGRTEFLNKNKKAMADFMEDYVTALKWFLDPKNHDEASEITGKFVKRKPAIYKAFAFTKRDYYRSPTATPNIAAVQRNIDLVYDLGVIKKKIKVAPYVDLSALNEAKKRLGLK